MIMQANDVLTLILVAILMSLLIYAITSAYSYIKKRREMRELEDTPTKIVTVVTCQQNDYTIEREFREGDFIGKIEGKCPKCGSPLIITKIYAVSLMEKIRKSL